MDCKEQETYLISAGKFPAACGGVVYLKILITILGLNNRTLP
jgi:hypothetical protein